MKKNHQIILFLVQIFLFYTIIKTRNIIFKNMALVFFSIYCQMPTCKKIRRTTRDRWKVKQNRFYSIPFGKAEGPQTKTLSINKLINQLTGDWNFKLET